MVCDVAADGLLGYIVLGTISPDMVAIRKEVLGIS